MKEYDFILISKYARSSAYLRPTRHHYYANELAKNGYRVLLLSSRSNLGSRLSQDGEPFYDYVELPGVRVNRGFSMKRIFSWLQFEWRLFMWLKKSNLKTRVLWVSSLSILTPRTVYPHFAESIRLFEVRDIYPETLISLGKLRRNGPLARLLRYFVNYAHVNADMIVSSLDNYQIYLKEYFPGKLSQYVWLPTGADSSYYRTDRLELTSTRSLAYAGTIGHANDVLNLLETFNTVWLEENKIKFYLYGDGPLRKELELKFSSDRVIFMGLVAKRDLPMLLSQHHCLVNSWHSLSLYKYGVSPNKWVEYALSGRPVMLALDYPSTLFKASGLGRQVSRDDSAMRQCVLDLICGEFRSVESVFLTNMSYEYKTKQLLDKIF